MVLILSRDDIAAVVDRREIVDVVEEAFATRGEDAVLPDRIQMEKSAPHGKVFVMPGFEGGDEQKLGMKVVTEFPENESKDTPTTLGTIGLYDPETGALNAVMDGTYITNYRTGAISVVAARYLAPEAPTKIGVFGSGTQARHQVLALDASFNLDEIELYSPSDRRYEAVEALADDIAADLRAVDVPGAVCEDAEIVVAATTATRPVFDDSFVSSGTLYISIGTNDRSMRELPGSVMERAERIFVDDYDRCITVGDLAEPLASGRIDEGKISPLGDVVSSEYLGRRDPEQVFAVKSVGTVLLDLYVASLALDRARAADRGTDLAIQE